MSSEAARALCPPKLQVPAGGREVPVVVDEPFFWWVQCSYGTARIDILWNAPGLSNSLPSGNCTRPARAGDVWSNGVDRFSDEFQFALAASGEYFLQVTGVGFAGPAGEPRLDVLKAILAKAEAAMFALECDYQTAQPSTSPPLLSRGVKDSFVAGTVLAVPPTIVFCAEAAGSLILGTLAPPVAPVLTPPTASACLASASTMITGAFAVLVDPPDRKYRAVAVARRLPAPGKLTGRQRSALCLLAPGTRACARLVRAFEGYLGALTWQAELMTTAAVAANRFNTAVADRNLDGQTLQRAAFRVYAGALRLSGLHLDRWARELRQAFPWSRADPRLTAAQVAATRARLLRLEAVPDRALRFLRANGFAAADVRSAIREADRVAGIRNAPLSLRSILGKRSDTRGLLRSYEAVTLSDVALLVTAFRRQGGIPGGTAAALERHLAAAGKAASARQRRQAIARFLQALFPGDRKAGSTTVLQRELAAGGASPSALPRTARGFLWLAAAPLRYR